MLVVAGGGGGGGGRGGGEGKKVNLADQPKLWNKQGNNMLDKAMVK